MDNLLVKIKSSISTMMMLLILDINIQITKESFSTNQPRLVLKVKMFMPVAILTSEEELLPLLTSFLL